MKRSAIFRTLLVSLVCSCSPCRPQAQPSPGASPSAQTKDSSYILGQGDQIAVQAPEIDEISKSFRIDGNGNINPPLVGRCHVDGLTAEQVEDVLAEKLKPFYTDPKVSVSVTQFQSQPVSLLGAVVKPDIYQVQGRKSLFEVIAMAGGLRTDAGSDIDVLRKRDRGPLPVPDAKPDSTGRYWIATIPVTFVLDGKHPEYNIYVRPEDVISIAEAEMVYVVGSVVKSGGYLLGDKRTMTALQAISLAGGLDHAASPQRARVLRQIAGSVERKEIPVNVKRLMGGEGSDFELQANDILFIPNSMTKNVALRTLEASIQIGTGLAIYRP